MKEYNIDDEYTLKYNDKTKYWDNYKLGALLPHEPKKLYKYYPLTPYGIDAFLRSYFYLSNPANFNDPFDCNINLATVEPQELNKMTSVKRNNVSNIGICSLSETIDNPILWGHYTNNYNGFALEFDGHGLNVHDEHLYSRMTIARVIYPKIPKRIDNKLPFALHYFLTTKFKDWEYEKEWRIIAEIKNRNKDDDTRDSREMLYYPKCLRALYVGHKILDETPNLMSMLFEIVELKYPEIPIYVVYPHPTELRLNFEKIWN